MYYYVVDPPNNAQTPKIAQRLQELITPLGISGEIGIASPARSAEELTYMGVDKGYTTIIAVGGDASSAFALGEAFQRSTDWHRRTPPAHA